MQGCDWSELDGVVGETESDGGEKRGGEEEERGRGGEGEGEGARGKREEERGGGRGGEASSGGGEEEEGGGARAEGRRGEEEESGGGEGEGGGGGCKQVASTPLSSYALAMRCPVLRYGMVLLDCRPWFGERGGERSWGGGGRQRRRDKRYHPVNRPTGCLCTVRYLHRVWCYQAARAAMERKRGFKARYTYLPMHALLHVEH
eukprot:2261009-Rhodomonas_salina.1